MNLSFISDRVSIVRRGFTFVEAVIVLVLSTIVFYGVQAIFSHGIRTSMKGVDFLESTRAANALLRNLQQDLRESLIVQTPGGRRVVPSTVTGKFDPEAINGGPLGSEVKFGLIGATVTYKLMPSQTNSIISTGDQGYIVREEEVTGQPKKVREFGVPRVKKFEVVQLFRDQRVTQSSPPYSQGQLYVRFVIGSDDPRFPASTIQFGTLLSTSQLASTTWWNYMFPLPQSGG